MREPFGVGQRRQRCGDEFALLLRGAEADATAAILTRLTATIQDDVTGVGAVRASFGSARCPDDGTDREALVAAADARLYAAKRRLGEAPTDPSAPRDGSAPQT